MDNTLTSDESSLHQNEESEKPENVNCCTSTSATRKITFIGMEPVVFLTFFAISFSGNKIFVFLFSVC